MLSRPTSPVSFDQRLGRRSARLSTTRRMGLLFANQCCILDHWCPPPSSRICSSCLPKNFYKQCQDLFDIVQLRAVWQPMTFVYICNALQLTNAAWLDWILWPFGIRVHLGIMTNEKFMFAPCPFLAYILGFADCIGSHYPFVWIEPKH